MSERHDRPVHNGPAHDGPARNGRVEQIVASVWHEVLERADIRPDDDFFALGGDSLHAVRIVARVEEALETELSVRVVLESRTLRGMTEQVQHVLAARQSGQ